MEHDILLWIVVVMGIFFLLSGNFLYLKAIFEPKEEWKTDEDICEENCLKFNQKAIFFKTRYIGESSCYCGGLENKIW